MPQPFGLGRAKVDIDRIIAERKSAEAMAATQGPASDEKGGRPEKGSHRPPLPKGSNNAKRLTARIARDRPDILERMKAGEFKSVRAAAREAGIVRDSIRPARFDPAAHTPHTEALQACAR